MVQVTISGRISSAVDGAPVRLIRVTAYRELSEVAHAIADDDGGYRLELPHAQTVTLRFDTSPSFVNVEDWHPSVMTDVVAAGETTIDRALSRCGYSASIVAVTDVLSSYQFCALWVTKEEASLATRRLLQVLALTPLQNAIQRSLDEHFRALSSDGD